METIHSLPSSHMLSPISDFIIVGSLYLLCFSSVFVFYSSVQPLATTFNKRYIGTYAVCYFPGQLPSTTLIKKKSYSETSSL